MGSTSDDRSMTIHLQSSQTISNNLYVVFLVFSGLLVWMQPLVILGLPWSAMVIAFVGFLFLISIQLNRPIKYWALLLVSLVLVTAIAGAVYHRAPALILSAVYFSVAVISLSLATGKEIRRFVEVSSLVLLAILVGAALAGFLATAGFSPLMTVARPDSSQIYSIYPFSLTLDTQIGNRPMGIYDEPGALAMVTAIIVFLRISFGLHRSITWVLAVMGFVTSSLAYLVFFIFLIISQFRITSSLRSLLFLGLLVTLSAGFVASPIGANVISAFQARLVVTEDEEKVISGDNRTVLLLNAIGTVSSPNFPWWMGLEDGSGRQVFQERYGHMGENVIAPIAHHGVLRSWPYYLFLFFSLFLIRGRKDMVFFGIVLLLLQRPYVMNFGYSLLFLISLWVQYRKVYGAETLNARLRASGCRQHGAQGFHQVRLEDKN